MAAQAVVQPVRYRDAMGIAGKRRGAAGLLRRPHGVRGMGYATLRVLVTVPDFEVDFVVLPEGVNTVLTL